MNQHKDNGQESCKPMKVKFETSICQPAHKACPNRVKAKPYPEQGQMPLFQDSLDFLSPNSNRIKDQCQVNRNYCV